METKIKKLVLISGATRVSVILLQIVANWMVPDHDADVFLYPKRNLTETVLDKSVDFLLGGLVRWDAQYFMHIASYGYTYENTLAFFPLYPMLVRGIAFVLSYFILFLNENSLLLLVFVMFNCCLFIKTTVILYRLSFSILKDSDLAYKSAVLFCINPATIFFVAPYTETLFCYLTYNGLLNLTSLKGSILIALSTCVRSNGILNVFFLLYFKVKSNLQPVKIVKNVLTVAICLTPFFLVQLYAYIMFCRTFQNNVSDFLVDFGSKHKLILPGSGKQKWCQHTIPLAYSYIQDHYWNVGFFRYFQAKQIPNFILAAPLVLLIGLNTVKFIRDNLAYCLMLGLVKPKINKQQHKMFVFVVHTFFLTVFCFFCIHVQVTTRMICSASPVIYWYCASYFKDTKERDDCLQNTFVLSDKLNKTQKIVRLYFVSYCIVGTVMFCNFLPWT